MPIIKSAKKAARQAEKRTRHNVEIKKSIKVATKEFKADPTPQTLAKAQSEIDKAVKKDLLKKNTASRRKAKLYRIAKEAGMKLTGDVGVAEATVRGAAKKVQTEAEKVRTEAKKTAARAKAGIENAGKKVKADEIKLGEKAKKEMDKAKEEAEKLGSKIKDGAEKIGNDEKHGAEKLKADAEELGGKIKDGAEKAKDAVEEKLKHD